MNFREKALKYLFDRGLFENQASAVLDHYLSSSHGELMKERMNDDESGYPPQFFATILTGLKVAAVEWIDENKPLHWARAMFAS